MPSYQALRTAVGWAAGALDVRRLHCEQARILPWSATCRLNVSGGSYWLKVGVPAKIGVETRILSAARELSLPGLPRLYAFSSEANALLLAEVQGPGGAVPPEQVIAVKLDIGRALADRVDRLDLPLITATSITELLAEACRSRANGWLDADVTDRLSKKIIENRPGIKLLDAELAGSFDIVHGDLHTGNALQSQDGPVILDWSDAGYGSRSWDDAYIYGIRERNGLDERAATSAAGIKNHVKYSLMSSLKGLADLLTSPVPSANEVYSIEPLRLRCHVIRRAESTIGMLERWRTLVEAL